MKAPEVTNRLAALITFALYFTFIAWLAFAIDASIDQVLIAFSPALLFWAVSSFVDIPFREYVYLLGPVLLAAAFFVVMRGMAVPNVETITGINVVLMYLFALIFFITTLVQKQPVTDDQMTRLAKEAGEKKYYEEMAQRYAEQNQQYEQHIQALQARPQITQENFDVTLRGIEDKCKALNASIGRVYSDKHGGSPDMRSKLKIDRELYNAFSEIASDFNPENTAQLRSVLSQIRELLHQLTRPEKDVLHLDDAVLPLEKTPSDTVLEVLAKNDKDPVQDYHTEASEVCEKVIAYLDSSAGSATQ